MQYQQGLIDYKQAIEIWNEAKIIKNVAQNCSDGMSRRLSRFRNGVSRRATWRTGEMLGACLLHAAALGVVYLGALDGGRSAGGVV